MTTNSRGDINPGICMGSKPPYGVWTINSKWLTGATTPVEHTKSVIALRAIYSHRRFIINSHFFLPAAGNYNGGSYYNAGTNGNYWSSTPNSNASNAYNLNFNSGNANVNNNNRNNGFLTWRAE